MNVRQVSDFILAKQNPPSVSHAIRTTAAALLSYLAARLLQLPEPYWAAISTLIVMQSTLGALLPISLQRVAGTAIGAFFGGAVAACFRENIWAFGFAVFLIGMLCLVLRIERSAYRYASIELAIVALIPRSIGPWLNAAHRFVEVSTGIAVGLLLTAVWPEMHSPKPDTEVKN
jgi:uncharacterized membrane protein YgaE (UPF0421/DUF939 family)